MGSFLPIFNRQRLSHPIFSLSLSLSPNPSPQRIPTEKRREADALPLPKPHSTEKRRPTVHRHPLRRTRREEPPSPPSSPFEEKLSLSEKLNRRSGKVADVVCDAFQVWACSVTSVVGAEEETKQAVSKELNSTCSSPCEWFICDEDQTGTRYFVIQGSESFASWQANLLFEPIQFEGLDVLVHRGIYEAAKGIYDQMLPEVHAHLKSRGPSATFRFTGHSLGGSLSLLVSLMLLIRGEVPLSALLPVITFGAPSVMCGGDQLLHRLGLPRSHVQAITMSVANSVIIHASRTSVLYAPMGEILILQPEEKISPQHDLLPSGSGLYLLNCATLDSEDPEKLLRAAQAEFFNSPHPLEILSDRSAYGSNGAIYRDHDMNSYLKSVLGVIRLELNQLRKTERAASQNMVVPSCFTRNSCWSRCGSDSVEQCESAAPAKFLRLFAHWEGTVETIQQACYLTTHAFVSSTTDTCTISTNGSICYNLISLNMKLFHSASRSFDIVTQRISSVYATPRSRISFYLFFKVGVCDNTSTLSQHVVILSSIPFLSCK